MRLNQPQKSSLPSPVSRNWIYSEMDKGHSEDIWDLLTTLTARLMKT